MTTSTPPLPLKRASKPIFWLPFGAGGMLSALTGPMLILVTLILVPLGILLPTETLSYSRVLAFVHSLPGKLLLLVLVASYLFHAFHRFYHTLHDFGIHVGSGIKAACHGAAALLTVYCAIMLSRL
jgi:fumarate reductase subunit D